MVHIGSSLGSPSSDVEQSLSSDVSANLPRLRAGRPGRSAIEKGVPPLGTLSSAVCTQAKLGVFSFQALEKQRTPGARFASWSAAHEMRGE